jgi:hypothetical protein
LANANGAFANANIFDCNWLQRKTAIPAAAPLANANVLILWDGRSFARILKSV